MDLSFCRLSLLVIFLSSFSFNLMAAELGIKHEYGLSILGSYDYEEPKLMHLRSGMKAEDDRLKNFGLLYNYKNAYLLFGYLNEIELDTSYQDLTQTYWSNGTGTMKDIEVQIYNVRALYGIQLSDKLMFKTGLGYRHLYHFWQNKRSTTGAIGYDREQDYSYVPFIAELKMPIPELNIDGKLNLEFDQILEGNNTSYLAYLGGSSEDMKFNNNDGYIWKVSYEGKINDFTFEPYFEFMHVDDSDIYNNSHEPLNTTKEYGIKITKALNVNRYTTTDFKKFINNDNFYFGFKFLEAETETGLYDQTGTAKINDKDYGYSIISGAKLLEGYSSLDDRKIRVDMEMAFNYFGETASSCSTGDTFFTDGRYRNNLVPSGSTLTCASDDIVISIESYSTTIGLKPSLYLISMNNVFINTNLGISRWNQHERNSVPGSTFGSTNYEGYGTYYGVGLGMTRKNLNISAEHSKHKMYYDAVVTSASLKYNF